MNQSLQTIRNYLLQRLEPNDWSALRSRLKPVRLGLNKALDRQHQPIEQVYFPGSGIISVVAKAPGVTPLEVGLVGLEGMTGAPIVMGDGTSPYETYVRVASTGHSIPAEEFRSLLQAHPAISRLMLNYVSVFTSQIAQTALANGRGNIDQRLARWLLMAADRVEGIEIPFTHELLAVALGVRRHAVTEATYRLEGNRLIEATLGRLTVRDRAGLESAASGFYGVAEREYRRLLGETINARPSPGEARDRRLDHAV